MKDSFKAPPFSRVLGNDAVAEIVGDASRAKQIVDAFARAKKAHLTRGLDGGGIARNKGLGVVQFSVTGNLPAPPIVNDQAWFFSQIGSTPLDNTYAIATMTPTVSKFTNAQVADWFTWNPTFCAALNVTSCNSAAALSSMQLRPTRFDPYGSAANDANFQAGFQTADQYQTGRGQFPIEDTIDGYTYFDLAWTAQNPVVSFVAAWFFGPRHDRRVLVPKGTAVAVSSPEAAAKK